MSRTPARTPAGLHKDIKRTQNGPKRKVKTARLILLAKPKKTSQKFSRPAQVVKPVRIAKAPKPSGRSASQPPKPGSKPPKKDNLWKRLAINGIPPKSPQSCEDAQAQIEQIKQQMQAYRGVGDRETTLVDIEERAYEEVEPQLLQIHGSRDVESRNEPLKRGNSEDELQLANLEEYYLSGGKMIPPTVQDFIGPVKINRVGDGRGRGLVLSSDVEAGELLLISNLIAKVSKMETEFWKATSLWKPDVGGGAMCWRSSW